MASSVNLINLENVDKSYGLKTLLDGVSLGVNSGDRIGVVGLNGGGKSTLIRILAGLDTADAGRVSRTNDLRMAVVAQDSELPGTTVGDAVLAGLADADGRIETHEWASDPRIRDVLDGIGINDLGAGPSGSGMDTPLEGLSGGERRRVGIAAALVRDLDLVILDEPTNHLDVEGVEWLAGHLLARRCALVVVTHDRWFLDTVATTTWEVHDGTVDVFEGGYNDWTFARAERSRQADAEEQRRANLARKELAWLRRGAPARTSKPRYRIEAAEALIRNVPAPRDTVELMSFATKRLGKKVIELEDATVTTPPPEERVLVADLTWRLAPGERIGLVGVNGSGKTTLLRTLAGEYPLAAGRRVEGRTVQIGWLRQELEDLDGDRRLLDAVEDIATRVEIGGKELTASQLAERLGFAPKRQRTPIRDLSGGERRRLQLTRVLMAEPNVLLLDEPTNDLDIDTLQELESLLDGWAGTLVVISHDRYLIERICDSTWALFGDGTLTNLPGGIQQYLDRRRELLATGAAARPAAASPAGPAGAAGAAGASSPGLSAQQDRELKKELNALERRMQKLDARMEQLTAQLAEAAAPADGNVDTARLTALDKELQGVRSEHEDCEMRWLEVAEEREEGHA
ncbi:ABC-F family ATP-binding cassette domain-containing protein [Corynebacterium terpenotabidum]|uniref:ABC transporter domain-containing protein n=1 Tax=Corynebacterium terpenotabidum Y-11 TaxID=1200352 RepID=S4XFF6_9CORY|nr:ABC-F family ATP-binding cassette domain-containing protein [Corynebacterium terpenotabidum]AGP31286.1 hypothetical protein A606_08205 [Corynebacterium terpenotabidum Y-11]